MHVRDWLDHAATGLTPAEQLRLFELGFATLLEAARPTLGEVTLRAIAERVLHYAAMTFPVLSSVHLEGVAIECRQLRVRLGQITEEELRRAIQFVLAEVLTIIGNLTAEVLTAHLHDELSGVELEPRPVASDREES
ncbi:MAG: hypothetical protein QOD06_240 [Candidatus Binatota bacterium]|nr:hypothetical protein [Candidatus Binatota bacterium]